MALNISSQGIVNTTGTASAQLFASAGSRGKIQLHGDDSERYFCLWGTGTASSTSYSFVLEPKASLIMDAPGCPADALQYVCASSNSAYIAYAIWG